MDFFWSSLCLYFIYFCFLLLNCVMFVKNDIRPDLTRSKYKKVDLKFNRVAADNSVSMLDY